MRNVVVRGAICVGLLLYIVLASDPFLEQGEGGLDANHNALWERLADNARKSGVEINAKLTLYDDPKKGLGLKANALISNGELLLQIPEKFVLHRGRVLKLHPEWKSMYKLGISSEALVGLFISRVRAGLDTVENDSKSAFSQVVYEIIRSYRPCSNGLLAGREVLSILPWWARQYVRNVQREKDAEFKAMVGNFTQQVGVTREQFMEGVCFVRSRGFPWNFDDTETAVVLFMDFLNHGDPASARFEPKLKKTRLGTTKFDGYVVRAARRISPGEEVSIHYGPRPLVAEFFDIGAYTGEYSPNPEVDIYLPEIPLRFPMQHQSVDPNYEKKLSVAKAFQHQPFFTLGRLLKEQNYGFLTGELALARIYLLNEKEYSGQMIRLALNGTLINRHLSPSSISLGDTINDVKRFRVTVNNDIQLFSYLNFECRRIFEDIPPITSKPLDDPIQQRLYDTVVEMRGVYRSMLYSCFATYSTVLKALGEI